MSAKHAHDLTPRTVRVAALLVNRFQNPDVAAYNRFQGIGRFNGSGRYISPPSSKRRELFWFGVGRALTAAYSSRGCPTNYEMAVRRDIDAARAAIAQAEGA